MKLYSYLQIQEIEAESLEQTGSTRAQLNEKLGAEAAAAIAEVLAECGCSPVVFAGPRRCGAIALAAARTMSLANLRPKIYFFNIRGTAAQPDTAAARDAYLEACGADGFEEVTGIFSLPELSGRDLVVDGLFGSEIEGPLGGAYQELVRRINESGARIVSIDMPSGLPADGAPGLINRNIIHADLTLALGLPRLAFFTAENAELVGQWQTLDAGYTRAALASRDTSFNLIERRQLRRWAFPPRRADSSKTDYGSLVIFAGSGGMMGAAQLATRAALRAGAGKVTCHSPRCGYNVMQTAVPEALFEIDHGDMYLRDIVLRRDYSAVAIGPGIGTHDETVDSLEQFLKVANANSRAVVLDADALNCIAIRPAMLDYIPVKSVLTPHAGEFDRIFGTHPNSAARLARAVEVAMFYKINIVLKGYHTAVVRLDGKVYYNPTGTPALATAGTGDVLTGIIGSLMAQGLSSEVAAMAGVYVHGLAGQMAEKDHGSYGVVAGDVADNVGRAINSIMN